MSKKVNQISNDFKSITTIVETNAEEKVRLY
jgi:hypothetical protein